jgi:DNA repair protein RecN (Recombination protein N)
VLLELHISGLGVIQDITLDPAPGLNVLTGETGAGKTMVTVGLALALGGRGQSGMVRPGVDRARVEARFEVERGAAFGEWAEDGQLVLGRAITPDGRSTARAGGQLSPVSTLSELGEDLVEVHGQNHAQRLLAPGAQLAFLDRFAGRSHVEALGRFRDAHGRLRALSSRLDRLDAEARDREREKDLLEYQAREIESAGLRPGEIADLVAEESRLAHAERIREQMGRAVSALAEEGGGADAVRSAAVAVGETADMDPGTRTFADRLTALAAEVDDATSELRKRAEGVELDPVRLEAVRERIAALRALERKYGEGEDEVLAFLERTRSSIAELERATEERDGLLAEIDAVGAEARKLADQLSATRREAAPRLAAAIETEVHELGMEGASVTILLEPEDGLGPDGAEAPVFHFSAGPGQASQPLSRVASGGELSRTMLACRTVLADLDDVPTLVFDEVDAGIGGRAGVAVGRRLSRLAGRRQVLVVTHLPQIACFADRHFRVTKDAGTARVAALDGIDRVEELSRMLSGMPTDEAATHAEQLLAQAAREKG